MFTVIVNCKDKDQHIYISTWDGIFDLAWIFQNSEYVVSFRVMCGDAIYLPKDLGYSSLDKWTK